MRIMVLRQCSTRILTETSSHLGTPSIHTNINVQVAKRVSVTVHKSARLVILRKQLQCSAKVQVFMFSIELITKYYSPFIISLLIVHGALRLTNRTSGVVQAYTDSGWTYVCTNYYYYNFDIHFSDTMDIACRELGYARAKSFHRISGVTYSTSQAKYSLILGTCNGYDARIADCKYAHLSMHCNYRISLTCETGKHL